MRLQPTERTRWRKTVRVVAVTFLLLACADLALPWTCGEDNEPLFPTQAATAGTFAHTDDSGEPQPHPGPAEDCFCCCSHILSSESGSPLAELTPVSGAARITAPSIPLAPVRFLFHPPRLA